jgi:hypothetical protein
MGRKNGYKAAISITLDTDILAFFSNKNTSGEINAILRRYLRWKLGDSQDLPMFNHDDEKTKRQLFAPALAVVQEQFGYDSMQAKIMVAIFDEVVSE